MKTKSIFSILALIAVFFILSSIELKAQAKLVGPDQISRVDQFNMQDPEFFFRSTGRSNERNSRLMLSKRYDGETVSKKGVFNIESSTTRLRFSIDGSVRSGTISVAILLPDNKTYKTITIDDAADIQWSESINIKEGETKDHGNWKYEITTAAAKGSYHLSINTF